MIGDTTVQIAIRLPDDMVTFLDRSVAAGNAPSRAALVTRALEREMRRHGGVGLGSAPITSTIKGLSSEVSER